MGSNYELNEGDNFVFCIDVSASMQIDDCPGKMKRIDYLKEKVSAFIHAAGKYDSDGIDLITFGRTVTVHKCVTPDNAATTLSDLVAVQSKTDTAGAIWEAYVQHKAYRERGGTDQTVVFIATDGQPTDQEAVVSALRAIAKEQQAAARQFCVSFLTVGVISPELRQFLMMLDDTLAAVDSDGKPIDIVDVKALDDVDFETAFEGAIND